MRDLSTALHICSPTAMAYSVHVAPHLVGEWTDSGWRLFLAEYAAEEAES